MRDIAQSRRGKKGRVESVATAARSIEEQKIMLYTIAVVLVILWILGMVTSTTMGGLVHVLLVVAVIVVLLRVISGRNPL